MWLRQKLYFGTNSTHKFHCNSLPLEVVEDYKYLGIWISKKRNFKKAIHHIACQSKKVIFALKQCLVKLQAPPVSVALRLFNSIIDAKSVASQTKKILEVYSASAK